MSIDADGSCSDATRGEHLMFTAYCPREAADVLLTYGRLRTMRNSPLGIELAFDCWCGEALEVLTGYAAPEPVR
jgi:hypothetical protein